MSNLYLWKVTFYSPNKNESYFVFASIRSEAITKAEPKLKSPDDDELTPYVRVDIECLCLKNDIIN